MLSLTIGHFRITWGPLYQSECRCSSFHMQIKLIFMWMEIDLHMKGWAPRLALKKRPEVTRKWPILFVSKNWQTFKANCSKNCLFFRWKVFHVFFPRQPRPLPTSHRPKTTWQRNPWLSIESLQRLPLHLPWMWIPSTRIGSKRCFTEIYIAGGVFNINLASAKTEVKSPEVDPKRKKRRLIIESDSSQESTTWCYFKIRFCCYRIFLLFIRNFDFLEQKI